MTEIITGVHCYMLITVLIFLFQISFRSYLMFSKLIQIASRGTFLHALVLCISICICNCIWSHFQTPCIAHHKMLYIILRELNVFDKNIKTNNHFIIFWEFLRFYQIFVHHKWNDARLLLTNMVYTSSLTSCRTT